MATVGDFTSSLFANQQSQHTAVVQNIRINQDNSCFVCSTNTGFHIFNIEPLRERCHVDLKIPGSVYKSEMLHRTNLVAVISGKGLQDSVLIWDDHLKKFVLEFKFSSPVASVRLRKDRIIISLASQIYVYSFPSSTPTLLFTANTHHNPNGICDISSSIERGLLAFPSKISGKIQVIDITHVPAGMTASPVNVDAHKHEIACIALNHEGTLLASASIQGTLIRIFNVERLIDKPKQIVELRRGSDMAYILCISFSHDSKYLCTSSDKGTVHIFSIGDTTLNKRSRLAPVIHHGAYLNSLWALTKFNVPSESPCQCCFIGQQNVLALCLDGSCYKYVFTTDGSCMRQSFDKFIDPEDEEF